MKTTLLTFFLCLMAATANATDFPTPITVPNCIGVNVNPAQFQSANDFDMLQASGVGFVRMDFVWQNIWPQNGSANYGYYDNFISNCAARGIKVYGILAYGNTNIGDPTQPSYYDQVDFRNYFSDYATNLVSHCETQFPGEVMTWELWNEPNNPGFWPGAAPPTSDAAIGQYINLAKAVLPTLRSTLGANSYNTTLIGPAIGAPGWGDGDDCVYYLQACKDAGLLEPNENNWWFDGISIHPYQAAPPEAMSYTAAQHGTLAWTREQLGYAGPILSGEWGYSTADPDNRNVYDQPITTTPQLQADYLQRMMLINVSQGVPYSNWYDWRCESSDPTEREYNFGLLDVNGAPKPAFYAMKALTTILQDKTFVNTTTYQNLADSGNELSKDYVLAFQNSEGRETYALWTNGTPEIRTTTNGTHYFTSTPLYVGPYQNWKSANGNWSSGNWDSSSDSHWVTGSQARFYTGGFTVAVDTTAVISGLQFDTGNVTLSNGGGELNFGLGGGSFHTAGSYNDTVSAIITGGGDPSACQFRKTGTGTLTLGGYNTVLGELIIAQGTVKADNTGALSGLVVVMNNDNCLTFGTGINNFYVGGLAGAGNLALTNVGTLNVGGDYHSSYSGVLSGGAALAKIGAGNLILSGDNIYSGGTTISGGSIKMGHDHALGTGAFTLSGGALDLNGYSLTERPLTISSSSSGFGNWNTGTTSSIATANVAVNSDFYTCGTGNITFSGNLSGNPKHTIQNTCSLLTLSGTGDNAYLAVNAGGGGTVRLNKTNTNTNVHAVGWIDGINPGATVQYTNTGDYQVWQGGTINLTGGTLDFYGKNQFGTSMTINANASKIANSAYTTSTYTPNSVTVNSNVTVETTGDMVFDFSGAGPFTCGNGSNTVLQKTGNGTLSLRGNANNVFLALDAQAGTIVLDKTNSSADIHAAYFVTINPNSAVQYASTGGGDYQLAGSGWINMAGGTLDFHGKNQTGTGITINANASKLANSAAYTTSIYSPNNVTVNSNVTVETTGDMVFDFSGAGPFTCGNGSNTYLQKTGAGTLSLRGNANNAFLALDAQAGTIVLDKSNSSVDIHAAYFVTINPNSAVQYASTGGGDYQLAGGGWVNMAGGTLDFNGKNQIGGALAVTTANSTLANWATGTTSTYTPDTFTYSQDFYASVNTDSTLVIDGAIVNNNGAGYPAMIKTGAGALTLRGATQNTSLTLNATGGNVNLDKTSGYAAAAVRVLSGGTVNYTNADDQVANWVSLQGGTLNLNGRSQSGIGFEVAPGYSGSILANTSGTASVFSPTSVALNSNLTVNAVGNLTLTPQNGYSGRGGTITKTGAGTLTMTTIARNVGTTLNFSISGGSIATSTANSNFTGRKQSILGGYATYGSTTWAVSGNTGGPWNLSGLADASYFSGFGTGAANQDIDAPAGSSSISNNLTINSLRFKGSSANSSVSISSGTTLTVASGGILESYAVNNRTVSISGSGSLTSGNGQDLIIHQNNTSNTLTISANITGSIGLTKSGAGTVIFSNTKAYTGVTNINAGTLLVNNTSGSGTGTGAVYVNNGGTLGGTGRIAGNVSVAGGGMLNPGSTGSTETLTMPTSGSTLTLNDGGILKFDFSNTSTLCDKIAMTNGILAGSGVLTINVNELLSPPHNTTFNIITGILTNNFAGSFVIGTHPTDHDWTCGITGSNVWVHAAPEPGTIAILATALLSLGAYSWRKRRAVHSTFIHCEEPECLYS